jgi:hypothetical protein
MNAIIAIATGSFLSLISVFRPDLGIRWTFATAILLVGTVYYFLPQYNYIGWGAGAAGILLFLVAFLYLLSNKFTTVDRITLLFFIFAFFLTIPIFSNISKPLEIVAFAKNIVQYWGFVPLAALGFLSPNSRQKIYKLLIITVIIQAIVSVYQAAFIVEWSTRLAGGDSVVGTFGGTPDGGGSSGAQTIFLSVVISLSLALYISEFIKLIQLIPFLIVCLIPIALNETKVFFVLMLIIIIYLFFTGFRKFPSRTLNVSLIGIGLVILILMIYLVFLQHSYAGHEVSTVSEYANRLTQSDSGLNIDDGKSASNSRLGSIVFWWNEMTVNNNIFKLLVGHGLGASKSGGVFLGKLADKDSPYYGLKLDRTGLSTLLWDIGLLGTSIFFIIFIAAWSLAMRTRIFLGLNNYEGAIMWGIESGIIVLALSNIYDSYFFTNPGLNAFTMLVFALVVATMRSVKYRLRKKSTES